MLQAANAEKHSQPERSTRIVGRFATEVRKIVIRFEVGRSATGTLLVPRRH